MLNFKRRHSIKVVLLIIKVDFFQIAIQIKIPPAGAVHYAVLMMWVKMKICDTELYHASSMKRDFVLCLKIGSIKGYFCRYIINSTINTL